MAPVYLDNHATTRVDPRVLDEMLPFYGDDCGNPGSPHGLGDTAKAAVDLARDRCSSLLGGDPRGLIFTSGATESNNLAITGIVTPLMARLGQGSGRRILYSAIEHKSVCEPAKAAASANGLEAIPLPVDSWGRVSLEQLRRYLSDGKTVFVSVQLANNEVGSVQDIQAIGADCARVGVPLHVDATQGVGKVAFSVRWPGIAAVSISGHKMHGPKGVGALMLSPGVELTPILLGGGQEHGARAGTLNVPGIVGLGAACAIYTAERGKETQDLAALRDRFVAKMDALLPGCAVVGPFNVEKGGRYSWPNRLPNNLSLMIPGVDGKALVAALRDRVCFSTGAACGCKMARSTDVLRALGLPDSQGISVVRFGFGRFNTPSEIEYAAKEIARVATSMRANRTA